MINQIYINPNDTNYWITKKHPISNHTTLLTIYDNINIKRFKGMYSLYNPHVVKTIIQG